MRRCFHVGALEYALNGREFGTSDDVGPPPPDSHGVLCIRGCRICTRRPLEDLDKNVKILRHDNVTVFFLNLTIYYTALVGSPWYNVIV